MLLAALLLCQDPAVLLSDVSKRLAEPGGIQIEATLSRTQVLSWESFLAEAEGTVEPARNAFRVNATVRELSGERTWRVSLVREGARFLFADHDARTFVEGDQGVLGGLPSRMALDLAGIVPASPALLADSGSPELRAPIQLGDERCRVLLGKLPDGPTAHVWYLSERDGLPRLWETTRDLGGGDSLRKRMTLRRIVTGTEPLGELSAASLFPGYSRAEAVAWADPEKAARSADHGNYTSLAGGLDTLRADFNAARDHVRAVGMFSPT